ncbi:MAG: 16S rRNA (cytosine(967)-C(5))-methyltransferase RsmB [Clostridia bacterium]|nr:16S rRNA (cytosine(967)-C(5))-methyltransferase RsmB [Clostridia bacterium]
MPCPYHESQRGEFLKNSAREVALLTLSACEKQGAWSDLSLKKNIRDGNLDSRDAALATRLCFGVLQNKLLCDFYIDKFSTVKPEKLENKVLNALRLGIYQMAFLTKIPVSAAVNESVELARKYSKNPRSPGLVNGILRGVARNLDHLPLIEEKDPAVYLSIRHSHPEWLVRTFLTMLSLESTEALLSADNSEPATVAQVNTTKAEPEAVLSELRSAGAEAELHPWLPGCLTLTGAGDLERLAAFREGQFYIQDAASRLAVLAAAPVPGMRVLDACAAPGGKSCAAAIAMEDRGEVLSCDIHPHKKALIDSNASRLGLSAIRSAVLDAKTRREDLIGAFDLVLADVPCSGLGIIRKKPDIRYKDPGLLPGLPRVQRAILDGVSACVKPGGVLLYATCTLLPRENGDVVAGFLGEHPDFAPEPFSLPAAAAERGEVTLLPHRHGTDGFYIAKLRRSV